MMLVAEIVDADHVFPSPAKLSTVVYGIYVLHVVPGWRGPIRLILRRTRRRSITIWGAEATAGYYYQVRLQLYPHQGQTWTVCGGAVVISGVHGLCACCYPVFSPPLTALLRELMATPPPGAADFIAAEVEARTED